MVESDVLEITRNEADTKTIIVYAGNSKLDLSSGVDSVKISIGKETQDALYIDSRTCTISDAPNGEITFDVEATDFSAVTFEVNEETSDISPKKLRGQLEILLTGNTYPKIVTFDVILKCDVPVDQS